MSLLLLQSAMLAPAELAFNTLLRQNADNLQRLAPFSGRVLNIRLSSPGLSLAIGVKSDGIRLYSSAQDEADAEISGTPGALLNLLLNGNTHSLHKSGVRLKGSTGLVQGLQGALKGMSIDWEYQLSRIAGDIPTQLLSDSLSSVQSTLSQGADTLRQDFREYLSEENPALAGRAETDALYDQVLELQENLDRLEARMDSLTQQPPTRD